MMQVQYLNEALQYNPETGEFTWRVRPRSHIENEHIWKGINTRCAGKRADIEHGDGYRCIIITFEGERFRLMAHNVAWAMMTGAWPEHEIDHEDRDPSHNQWDNLRAATHAENGQSQRGQE